MREPIININIMQIIFSLNNEISNYSPWFKWRELDKKLLQLALLFFFFERKDISLNYCSKIITTSLIVEGYFSINIFSHSNRRPSLAREWALRFPYLCTKKILQYRWLWITYFNSPIRPLYQDQSSSSFFTTLTIICAFGNDTF